MVVCDERSRSILDLHAQMHMTRGFFGSTYECFESNKELNANHNWLHGCRDPDVNPFPAFK
jgi:hypothetical protein